MILTVFLFFLGTHHPNWLWDPRFRNVPLFVSHRRLRDRKTPFPRALTIWALDSGGFSEIREHGRWLVTPAEYVAAVRRYARELGMPQFAAIMDWMCEPWMIQGRRDVARNHSSWAHGTRAARGIAPGAPDEDLTAAIIKHQRWTVRSFLLLRRLAPEIPWMPVLQGWCLEDYIRCYRMYLAAGVDLTQEPIVGLGSVCRRQATQEIAEIVAYFADLGLNLHGFGVKTRGLENYSPDLLSADSMAWSVGARHKPKIEGHTHRAKNCANCPDWALMWRRRILDALPPVATQRLRQPPLLAEIEDDLSDLDAVGPWDDLAEIA